ncbi:MAG: alanine racemase [Pyrinomonadaceae bacterium]
MASLSSGAELSGGRPTWVEIDLEALAANFRVVCGRVSDGVSVMAVVKADAYGHGAVECARRLEREGAEWFGVALVEEGLELRRAGIGGSVLCFEGVWEGQAAGCLQQKLTPVIYRLDVAEYLDRTARAAHVVADVHVKVDTGMGRLGVRYEEAAEFAARLSELKNLRVDGLMTHFAAADEAVQDNFTAEQVARFEATVAAFRAYGHELRVRHLSNSAAVFAHPQAQGNLVRPGGVLYGLWRDVLQRQPTEGPPPLKPVMSLRSRIALVKHVRAGETLGYGCTFTAKRPTRVATLPLGYHDGYPRALSNHGHVIVGGSFAPIVGRVSMDLTLVDVTDVPHVKQDDVVTLIGGDGPLSITAEEIAATAGTISYEITCGISRRVPRIQSPKSKVQGPKSETGP